MKVIMEDALYDAIMDALESATLCDHDLVGEVIRRIEDGHEVKFIDSSLTIEEMLDKVGSNDKEK